MDFVPNHGSTEGDWFKKSEEKDPDYIDYFVWEDPIVINGTNYPPNNWVNYNYLYKYKINQNLPNNIRLSFANR